MSGRRSVNARALVHTVVLAAVALGAGVAVTPSSQASAHAPVRAQAAVAPPSYAGRTLYVSQTPSSRTLADLAAAARQAAAKRNHPGSPRSRCRRR